jgi:hypothetical protein
MADSQGLIAEYQSLRDEILRAETLAARVPPFLLGASAATLSAVPNIESSGWWVSLSAVAFFIAWFANRLIQAQRKRVWRISTYIRVFIEPRLDLIGWETRLSKTKGDMTSKSVTNELIFCALIAGVALSLGIAGIVQTKQSADVKGIAIAGAIAITSILFGNLIFQSRKLTRTGSIEADFLEKWQEIAREEQQ